MHHKPLTVNFFNFTSIGSFLLNKTNLFFSNLYKFQLLFSFLSPPARKRQQRLYGESLQGELLDTREYTGIGSYEPSELVITVRAGTAGRAGALAEQGQCLAFEPPRFGSSGGGTCGAEWLRV